MDEKEKNALLQIARKSVEAAIKDVQADEIQVQINSPELEKEHGAFITLRKHGKLRGCIGRLTADTPLHKLVSEMAV